MLPTYTKVGHKDGNTSISFVEFYLFLTVPFIFVFLIPFTMNAKDIFMVVKNGFFRQKFVSIQAHTDTNCDVMWPPHVGTNDG